jgi:hypothetical protein
MAFSNAIIFLNRLTVQEISASFALLHRQLHSPFPNVAPPRHAGLRIRIEDWSVEPRCGSPEPGEATKSVSHLKQQNFPIQNKAIP